MISGFVTLEGEKMSKSKSNVVNPKEIMNRFGADALRCWAAGSKLGEDLEYSEKDILSGKKLVTKLLNASNSRLRIFFFNQNNKKNGVESQMGIFIWYHFRCFGWCI